MISIRFSNPQKHKVVIFDYAGSEILERMVLQDIEHGVLHSRHEILYITPKILFGILRNLKYVKLMRYGDFDRNLINFLKQLSGCLYRVYLLSCVECMRPKVVITFVDNSYPFQVISRIYKDALFIAVQNGMRIKDCLKDSRPPSPEPGSVISMPMLICFGRHDIDIYKAYNHKIDNYYPLGALRARYYRSFLSKNRVKYDFDLCLISTWLESSILGNYMPQFGRGMIMLDNFINQYIKESNISFCIALRSNDKKEEEYFRNIYGDRAFLITADRELMSSYDAIDRSVISISSSTTLTREAFGWGAKILSCNFSGDDQLDFPCSGFWFMKEQDYGLFKERLDYIKGMTHEEYHDKVKIPANYIMNNDSKPPHEFVRELILNTMLGKNDDKNT